MATLGFHLRPCKCKWPWTLIYSLPKWWTTLLTLTTNLIKSIDTYRKSKTTQSQTKYLTLCCIKIFFLLLQPFPPYFGLFSDFLFQLFFFSVAGTATPSVAVTLVFGKSVGETKKQKPALLFARFALRSWWLLRDSKTRMRSHTSPELQQSQNHSGLFHSESIKNMQSFLSV